MRLTGLEPRPGSLKRDNHLARVNQNTYAVQSMWSWYLVDQQALRSTFALYRPPVSIVSHGPVAMAEWLGSLSLFLGSSLQVLPKVPRCYLISDNRSSNDHIVYIAGTVCGAGRGLLNIGRWVARSD